MQDLHPSVVDLFGSLEILQLRVHYSLDRTEGLPRYLGSAWRGAIGANLKRLTCPFPERRECGACIIREHCPYFALYEKSGEIHSAKDGVRPYVFYPHSGANSAPTPNFSLDVSLFGSAVCYLPILWQAILMTAETGLGADRRSFEISRIEQQTAGTWYSLPVDSEGFRQSRGPLKLSDCLGAPPCFPWRFRLMTPVRLRRQGRYLSQMDWAFFLAGIAQRLETLLVQFQQGRPMGAEAWKKLQGLFQLEAKIVHSLHWQDWQRYSNRQRRKVPMGGLVGAFTIEQAPASWWPWLEAAVLTHVGKGAAMGMGRLVVVE